MNKLEMEFMETMMYAMKEMVDEIKKIRIAIEKQTNLAQGLTNTYQNNAMYWEEEDA